MQAQEYGVRVHLLGVSAPVRGEANQAALLKQEADHVSDLSLEEVRTFMVCNPLPATTPSLVASLDAPEEDASGAASTPPTGQLSEERVELIVEAALSQMSEESVRQVVAAGRYSIPPHVDGLLLTTATKLLAGGRVPDGAKKQLRGHFFAACERRLTTSP